MPAEPGFSLASPDAIAYAIAADAAPPAVYLHYAADFAHFHYAITPFTDYRRCSFFHCR